MVLLREISHQPVGFDKETPSPLVSSSSMLKVSLPSSMKLPEMISTWLVSQLHVAAQEWPISSLQMIVFFSAKQTSKNAKS